MRPDPFCARPIGGGFSMGRCWLWEPMPSRLMRSRLAVSFPNFPMKPPTSIRSEEHTSELQSLMRISYAVSCLKKKHTTMCRYHPGLYNIKDFTTTHEITITPANKHHPSFNL